MNCHVLSTTVPVSSSTSWCIFLEDKKEPIIDSLLTQLLSEQLKTCYSDHKLIL